MNNNLKQVIVNSLMIAISLLFLFYSITFMQFEIKQKKKIENIEMRLSNIEEGLEMDIENHKYQMDKE